LIYIIRRSILTNNCQPLNKLLTTITMKQHVFYINVANDSIKL
jgi:hypothetical protein